MNALCSLCFIMVLQSTILLSMELVKIVNPDNAIAVPEGKVRLLSADNKSFDIDQKVAAISPVLKATFSPDSGVAFRETNKKFIHLQEIHSDLLGSIVSLLEAISEEKSEKIIQIIDCACKDGVLDIFQEHCDFLLIPSWTSLYRLPNEDLALYAANNALKGTIVTRTLEHANDAHFVEMSENGAFLITRVGLYAHEKQHQYILWNMITKNVSAILLVDTPLEKITFCRNNSLIAAIETTNNEKNSVVHIWKTDGQEIVLYKQPYLKWLQWSPDSKYLALYSYKQEIGDKITVLSADGREIVTETVIPRSDVAIHGADEIGLATNYALSLQWANFQRALNDPLIKWIQSSKIISSLDQKAYWDYSFYLNKGSIIVVKDNTIQGSYLNNVTVFTVHEQTGQIVAGTSDGKLMILDPVGNAINGPQFKFNSSVKAVVLSKDDRYLIAADMHCIAIFTMECTLIETVTIAPRRLMTLKLSEYANNLVFDLFDPKAQESQINIIDLSSPKKLLESLNTISPLQGYLVAKLNKAFHDNSEVTLNEDTEQLFAELKETICKTNAGNTQAVIDEFDRYVKKPLDKKRKSDEIEEQGATHTTSTSSLTGSSAAAKKQRNQ